MLAHAGPPSRQADDQPSLRPTPPRDHPAARPGPDPCPVPPPAGVAGGGDRLRRGRLSGPGGLEPAGRALHDRHHPRDGRVPRGASAGRAGAGIHDLAHPGWGAGAVGGGWGRHRAGGIRAARQGPEKEKHGRPHRPAGPALRRLRLRARRALGRRGTGTPGPVVGDHRVAGAAGPGARGAGRALHRRRPHRRGRATPRRDPAGTRPGVRGRLRRGQRLHHPHRTRSTPTL